MDRYDRKAHLKRIHDQRKADTNEKAEQAIVRLLRANEDVNFNSVAEESGVSRSILYKHPEIAEKIKTIRHQQTEAPSPKQVKREMNDANKDALIDTLKRKIKALEKENKELREQMKKAYAQVYQNF